MKWLVLLLLAGCNITMTPPTVVCSEQHVWEDYHLAHDALEPSVHNSSSYELDLGAWNDLGTAVQLTEGGDGFPIEVRNGGDESSTWLGLASVNVGSNGHITSALVQMNSAKLAKYPANAAQHVLCQELGHLIGLDHQHALDSCMDDCAGRGSGWQACITSTAGTTPNEHDGEQLWTIYEHVTPGDPPTPHDGCTGSITIHIFPGS